MDKKEFKVGEKFQCGLVTLECQENKISYCDGCFFEYQDCRGNLSEYVGYCCSGDRTDYKNVIFKQIK